MKKKIKIYLFVLIFMLIFLFSSCSLNLVRRNIIYQPLFNGFIIFKDGLEPMPPIGTIVFKSKDDWDKFSKKYLPGVSSISTKFNDVNFKYDCIIYILTISPKSEYGISNELESIYLKNDEIIPVFNEYNEHVVYAINRKILVHPYLIIVKASTRDIPDTVTNIYIQKDKNK